MQREKDKSLHTLGCASCPLAETKRGYSEIEKEAFSMTWACDKFKDCLVGFRIETYHKPLIPLFTRKPMADLTPHLHQLRLGIISAARV